MNYPPDNNEPSQFEPPQQPHAYYPPQQQYNQQWQQPNTYPYYPPQTPPPPAKKSQKGLIFGLSVLFIVVLLCIVVSANSAQSNTSSNAQATAGQPDASASLVDQVKQALSNWPSAENRYVGETSPGFMLVTLRAWGDPAGEAETLAAATIIASGYQKDIWQAGLTGLQEVTVVIIEEYYATSSSNMADSRDIVKAIVLQATGTTLDWNSGTPAEQFRQFDVHWVITDGQEP